jgi:copper(I)-binding protein
MTMTTPGPRRRRAALGLLTTVALGGALAACGVGQEPQTTGEVPDTPGVDGAGGAMVLDDVYLQTAVTVPVGGSVPLRAALTDTSVQPDRLLAVSTPAAASIELLNPDGTVATGGITIAAYGQVDAQTGPVLLRLTGLTQSLSPMQIVPVTFQFQRAGSVTLGDVPATTPKQ